MEDWTIFVHSQSRFHLSEHPPLHQFPHVRVPIPLVIALCLAVIGAAWWHGIRDDDFLTPPSEAMLALIRMRVESSLPPADHPGDAVSAPPEARKPPAPPPPKRPKPVINPDDLTRPPSLDEYRGLASKGTAYLMDLAKLLESKGQAQRALIAWERVLDTGKPDETQASTAIIAIKRLRPTLPDWNTDPAQAIPVTLHAGTGKKTAELLKPILETTSRDLELASAGILKVTASVAAGRDELTASGPPPVALWFSGPVKNSRSTEVLAFTVDSPDSLQEMVGKTGFRILRGYLAREVSQTPPRALPEGTSALDALNTHITRRSWQEFGNMLNLPP
jgi:hypothetical protein